MNLLVFLALAAAAVDSVHVVVKPSAPCTAQALRAIPECNADCGGIKATGIDGVPERVELRPGVGWRLRALASACWSEDAEVAVTDAGRQTTIRLWPQAVVLLHPLADNGAVPSASGSLKIHAAPAAGTGF